MNCQKNAKERYRFQTPINDKPLFSPFGYEILEKKVNNIIIALLRFGQNEII